MPKKLQLKAKFEQVLLYADGPQVVMLSAPAESKIIGVAVNRDDASMPFYGAQISVDQFQDYLNEKFDLRYLLLKPDYRRNFFFDLSNAEGGVVTVERAKLLPEEVEQYLPDHGVFSRDHTEELALDMTKPEGQQTYGLDGKWEVPEVSSFYGQVTDLYAMFNSVDAFLDEQMAIDRKRRISEAFSKPFRGGGSYLSLYDSLADAAPRGNNLHLDGMSYNSPGYVRVRGQAKPLAEVRQLIEHFRDNFPAIAEKYRALDKFLAAQKLRRLPAARFSANHDLAAEVVKRTRELADALDAISFDDTMTLIGGNVLVGAKVTLSIYRRVFRVHEFFLQGRASFDVPTSQA